jgi:hypothetical protein
MINAVSMIRLMWGPDGEVPAPKRGLCVDEITIAAYHVSLKETDMVIRDLFLARRDIWNMLVNVVVQGCNRR